MITLHARIVVAVTGFYAILKDWQANIVILLRVQIKSPASRLASKT